MIPSPLPKHITQSPEWGRFKSQMGTAAVTTGEVQFTRHPVPLTPYAMGYCPKVDPEKIDWVAVTEAAKKDHCFAIRLDCPNVLRKETRAETVTQELARHGQKSPKTTFAKETILLDLQPDEAELLQKMKPKTRYNTHYAAEHGITVQERTDPEGFAIFLELQRATARRQRFLIHPDRYYQTLFETMTPSQMTHILVASHQNQNLAAYLLLSYQGVLYYPYGGSSAELRNLFPSNLLMWEAIRLGKKLGCTLMDMWGATRDETDPWWGFTRFKLGYGGELVEFIDSYDLVVSRPVYQLFNFAYNSFWKIVKLGRRS